MEGETNEGTTDKYLLNSFFNLGANNQAQPLLSYKASMDQLVSKNNKNGRDNNTINKDHQRLTTQVDQALDLN